MKIYKNLIEGTIEALQQIFCESKKTDQMVAQTLKFHKAWGSRDRNFVAGTIYGVVRNYRKYAAQAGYDGLTEPNSIKAALAVHLSQMVDVESLAYFDKINWQKGPFSPEIEFSYNDYIYQKFCEAFAKPEVYFEWLNQETKTVIRVNTIKSSLEKVQKFLTEKEIIFEPISLLENALMIHSKFKADQLDIYKKGWFEIQDGSSQMLAPFTGVLPGQKVIDACAGAGGKTLDLAANMKNKGELVAFDISGPKLKILKDRTHRAGVGILKDALIASDTTLKSYENWADVLVLDVPCSGSGTIKRDPDVKRNLDENLWQKIETAQMEILEKYQKMLKPGGTLIYSTCSVLKQENEERVDQFLTKHPRFELIDQKRILPDQPGFDGFFMAKFIKA